MIYNFINGAMKAVVKRHAILRVFSLLVVFFLVVLVEEFEFLFLLYILLKI